MAHRPLERREGATSKLHTDDSDKASDCRSEAWSFDRFSGYPGKGPPGPGLFDK